MKFFRRSFLLSVSLTFLVAYVLNDFGSFVFQNLSYYDRYQKKRMVEMVNLAKLGSLLLRHDEVRDLEDRLNEARSLHQIDFFILRKGDSVLAFWTPDGRVENININYRSGQMVISDKITYLAFEKGPYLLALGIAPSRYEYLRILAEQNKGTLAFDVILVVLLASGIAFYFFSDVRSVITALRSPSGLKRFKGGSSTLEAQELAQSVTDIAVHVDTLKQKGSELRRHIASAVRAELESGKVPPYTFKCTMVRTDINNYSTTFIEAHKSSQAQLEGYIFIINEFFTRASEVIARYNGYITDFVGDEIIYYFKDDEHSNSAATAVAAARDINEIAMDIQLQLAKPKGYGFTVKSALASGELRFGPLVKAHALSGPVFVETVRILSHVDEKQENSVYLPVRDAICVETLCTTEVRKEVLLKGIPGSTQLCAITSFKQLDHLLENLDEQSATQLQYFMRPNEIARVLSLLPKLSENHAVAVLNALEKSASPFSDKVVLSGYMAAAQEIISRRDPVYRLLSRILISSRTLIAREFFPVLKPILFNGLESQNHRVVANAVDALIHFDPENHDQIIVRLLEHSDNRVLANVLIKIGMVDLSGTVVKALHSLLAANDPKFVASGIYAVGELARFYRTENPLLLQPGHEFKKILTKVESLSEHPETSVQHQSQLALKKAGLIRQAPKNSSVKAA